MSGSFKDSFRQHVDSATSGRRLLIRADAGGSMGFGHFVRMCALAGYLRDDFRVSFCTRNPDGVGLSDWQRRQLSEAGAEWIEIPTSDMEEFNRGFLTLVGKDTSVVLDNYYYTTDYQTLVRERARTLVCIDDMHDRHFTADAVMTFLPISREEFSLASHTRFFAGPQWSFLRAPFLQHPYRKRDNAIRRIVMAMGGADPLNLTGKVLDAILKGAPQVVTVDVIAGDTVDVEADCTGRVNIHRRLDAEGIRILLDNADLGVFPASTICVEAFSRRLPVAAGHFVDNQEEFYARGMEKGWFMPLGDLRDSKEALTERMSRIMTAPLHPAPDFDFISQRTNIIRLFNELHDCGRTFGQP